MGRLQIGVDDQGLTKGRDDLDVAQHGERGEAAGRESVRGFVAERQVGRGELEVGAVVVGGGGDGPPRRADGQQRQVGRLVARIAAAPRSAATRRTIGATSPSGPPAAPAPKGSVARSLSPSRAAR